MKTCHVFFPVLLAAVAFFFVPGCASTPKPRAYSIRLSIDPALAGTTLMVDMAGANEISDLPKWQTYSVTEYWQPGNVFRRDSRKATMEFGRDRPTTQTLASTDPRWAEWLRTGAMHLVIVADIPGVVNDQAGNADPRRLIVPLDKAVWGKSDTIDIVVHESGLRLVTPRKS